MSEEEQETQGGTAVINSMAAVLRKKHTDLIDSQTVKIAIPGYDGEIRAEYKVLKLKEEVGPITRRAASEFKDPVEAQLYGSMDIMSRACIQLWTVDTVTNPDKPELIPMSKLLGPDAPPVRFTVDLAEIMGWGDVGGARELILKLFGNNEPAIMDHSQLLSRWMSDTTRQVNDDFLGGL